MPFALPPVLLPEQLFRSEKLLPGSIPAAEKLIVVLKQHRFYRQLCIELYHAKTTRSGKIKNPLTLVNPLDLTWKTEEPNELKFFSGVAQFQNNATANKSAADINALKAVTKNPLDLHFYYHNNEVSDNVVANALSAVKVGPAIEDLQLFVNQKEDFYQPSIELKIDGKQYPFNEVVIKFDYFVLLKGAIHLIASFNYVNIVQFFKQNKLLDNVHASRYTDFQQNILSKIEDKIKVHYTYIAAGTQEQILQSGLTNIEEKYIYLSDLDNYIIIEPVILYGSVEIPVLTKKEIYSTDKKGALFNVKRNTDLEDKFIALLIKQHPYFQEQLQFDLPYFYLPRKRFLQEDWFLHAFANWQQHGVTVLGFNKLRDNKLNANKAKITIRVTSGTNWFNTEINAQFGNKKASLKQLQKAVRNKNKFVHLDDGTLGILPEEWIEKFADYFNAGEIIREILVIPKISFSTVEQLFDAAQLDADVKGELQLLRAALNNFKSIKQVDVPTGLHTSLRDYQKHGLNWLNFLDDHNFGGCLADDMGLGKTIQIIAFILLQRGKRPHNTNLLVVPTSLIFNWQAEVEKFAPTIKIFSIKGAGEIRELHIFNDYEIVLVSYGTLIQTVTYLKKYPFNYIFLDESQNIKNIESQRYQAVRLLQSRNKICITGTPIENNVFDLFAQLSFACPGLLGNKQHFRDIYSIPIDKFKVTRRAMELQQKIAPFILRRTKKQVATELPEKTEMILYCPMDEDQRKIYNAYEKEFREFISAETNEEIRKNSMHVLQGLTRLRQICNSPVLLEEKKTYADASAKLDALAEQIESRSGQHKILIFSQFVTMLDLIAKEIKTRHIGFEYLTGSTKNREAAVNNFQNNQNIRVFLISLKAGGLGLNLAEADYVYLVDPWWNPAVENQAIDRAYRIGQNKNVVAVRLICPDTIEEKIIKLQDTKRELSNNLIKTDEFILKSTTKDDLLALLNH